MKQLPRTLVNSASVLAGAMTIYLSIQLAALVVLFGAAGTLFGGFAFLGAFAGPFIFVAILVLILLLAVVLYPWAPIIIGFVGAAKNRTALMAVSAFMYLPLVVIAGISLGYGEDMTSTALPPLFAYLAAFGLALPGWILKRKSDLAQPSSAGS